MTINERLKALRALMKERNIDIYVVPTSDFHQTETVGSYFRAREFMSGFTGSEGTLVVTLDEAALWVDGRYFLQAAKQLEGSEIIKMEMGEPGVLTIPQYIYKNLPKEGVVGFDGRVVNTHFAMALAEEALIKSGSVYCEEDLVGMVWEDRPELPKDKAWFLEEEFSGEKSSDKIAKLQQYIEEKDCDMQILSTLDDIAWLTNMRGNDVEFFPVVLAYMVVTTREKYLFMDTSKLDDKLKDEFDEIGLELREYDEIYDFAREINVERVLVNLNTLNYKIFSNIRPEVEVVDDLSPTQLWKACKNPVELENNKRAHIRDSVAQTKFIYWLKNAVKTQELTEISAAEKLLEFREAQERFIEPSFETIAGYEKNAAFVHYHATENDYAKLEAKGFLLVDSGAHYSDGSTDTTRTIVLGPISDKQKDHYTAVLRGMIRLSKAKFLYGCTGMNLDILCRGIMWDLNLDYKHGTGHGVGYISTIHEESNGFRWRKVEGINDGAVLEEGMVTSNEPGLYLEGEYGIRIENEIVVKKDVANEFGQFMSFDTITFVPIDTEAINKELMCDDEIEWLNNYHKNVYDKIEKYLEDDERAWLKEATKAI